MYLTFRLFGWKPSDYFGMDDGEKTVVRAFLMQYQEEHEKEIEGLKNA